MTLHEIATELADTAKSIILIYAFNATGKTRLSVAYKDLTKARNNGSHAGVYFNAYSEDLFVWDNDEENDNANIKLRVLRSSLNQYHSFLDVSVLEEKLEFYHPRYAFKLDWHEDLEKGIEAIRFFAKEKEDSEDDVVFADEHYGMITLGDGVAIDAFEKKQIKISRGEERIFIWCFFLALFEIDAWAGAQDAHIFIDDPVSSLDEHNIFITAESIFKIIDDNHIIGKKIIVTTHHIGLFSILADRLTKGEKHKKYENLTALYVLENKEYSLILSTPNKGIFLFHLHLMQILHDAVQTDLFAYHFVLLRQLLENISSFLGKSGMGYTLAQAGVVDVENTANTINSLSHKDAYRLQFNKMSQAEERVFKDVLKKVQTKYQFHF